jgi:hypothetical protein
LEGVPARWEEGIARNPYTLKQEELSAFFERGILESEAKL